MNCSDRLGSNSTSDSVGDVHDINALFHPSVPPSQAVATLKTTNGHRMMLKFLQYAQSSRCYTSSDSSVSYAAASLIFE